MTDIPEMKAALRTKPGHPCEVLAEVTSPPKEGRLLASIFDCGGFGLTAESDVDTAAAWSLVWVTLGVGSGAPAWSSRILGRIADVAATGPEWGGVDAAYAGLLAELSAVKEATDNTALLHLLRDLGRTCRSAGLRVSELRVEGASALQCFALVYAPGAEKLTEAQKQSVLEAARGSAVEEEIRLCLGL